jgi:hypothetical protein
MESAHAAGADGGYLIPPMKAEALEALMNRLNDGSEPGVTYRPHVGDLPGWTCIDRIAPTSEVDERETVE